ncbi:His-Xaa-Ser system-associated MauG-like protein [Oricola sp.]|uniref:His-Xaa-Ser system-associated MauG-like protein n=1 Tax=Oricola sp. TaxID=1979950 RepID=UPI0025DBAAC7|nr:His-Xaa-Ser system-associated MauG-like protein [Oricola sp.]MCI5073972.1 His-Xaa-Ser system-associated MauG-like protein [Oricola sp.]
MLFLQIGHGSVADDLRESVLRDQALKAGIVQVVSLWPSVSPKQAAAGKLLFESKELSLTREIACQSCHLDRFSSSDGIPLGIGTRGSGEGIQRMQRGGDMLPRNTLPFWGRGSLGFDVFFWDGKVDSSSGEVASQFGDLVPSDDPLVVAAHLPPVEIREMLRDDEAAEALRTESVSSAQSIYTTIEGRVQADPMLAAALVDAYDFERGDIRFLHVAESIAAFIRDRFRLQPTGFHRFVFDEGDISDEELAGGLLFYGRGRCVACHNGPFFSDLSFHAIPFSQFGYGRNGFGIDYGRFNVTMDPDDLYKFRTPPLYNVASTGPYSHSGAVADLRDAILAHVDPFRAMTLPLDRQQRAEFYRRLGQWAKEPIWGVELDEDDIDNLVAFLGTLSFDDANFQGSRSGNVAGGAE